MPDLEKIDKAAQPAAANASVDTTAATTPAVPSVGGAKAKSGTAAQDIEDPRNIVRQGLIVVIVFFGIFGLWSCFGKISGAIVAQGKIKIESERKTVQHLEGGIVDEILVREGQEVQKGDALVIMESIQVNASENMVRKQLVAQLASQARLVAEKDLLPTLQWEQSLRDLADKTDSADMLLNEEKIFRTRQDALMGQLSLLNNQVLQIEAQIVGFEKQLAAEMAIIATLHEELNAKRQLYNERFLERSQILELERTLASHQGSRGGLRQSIAEGRQKVGELKLRIEDSKNRFVEQATREMGRVDNELLQTRERVRPLTDARQRLQVTAPVSGKVVGLKVHSKGGVLRPGDPMMDIVPHDNPLIIDTRVPVNKITDVFVGQEAMVQLDAFDTRLTPHMPGKLTYISADRLDDPVTGMPYYLGYVELDPKALAEAELYLAPGMPATVYISTKKRTIVYYILEPLLKNWQRVPR